MPTVIPLNHQIVDDRTGNHFEINKVNHDGVSTTVEVGGGLVSAAPLVGSTGDTAPTAAVTQGNDAAREHPLRARKSAYFVAKHSLLREIP